MADETDPLVQAMIDAGLYPQRLRPLQQQYALGQQWMEPQQAQGRNVGNSYVAASPWEHLSNAIRQVVGAKMASGALQKEQGLTGSLGAGRQAYVQALQRAGGQQAPGTPEMLARPADPQDMQRLTMMGAASGDPAMENASKTAMQGQHYQNELQRLTNTADYQRASLALRGTEQGSTSDAYGNPIMYQKHALPGAVGAAGGAGGQRMGAGMGMSAQALDQAAELYSRTGQLPALRGKAASGLAVRIQNRAAELHGDADLAGNKAGYKADTASLGKLQGQSDALDAFENTALKNLDQFLQTAHSVVDTGSPLFNAPARSFQQSVAGDPKMVQFNTARQVAVQEISRVLGGSMGSIVSDSARHEASALLSPNASLAQIEAAAGILKQDMANRRTAMQEQIGAVRGRAAGKAGGGSSGAPPAAPPPAGGAPALSPKDAAAIEWAKKNPGDSRAAKILQVHGAGP